MISEKIELLGKGLYTNIPDVLTLNSIPSASELESVGSEDFDKVMLDTILPSVIEEDINCYDLLDIDYNWVCRALRILSYGPYHTTNALHCTHCGTSFGEYQVDLNTVNCIPLPNGFKNEIVIPKEDFIDFDGDIKLHLLTIRRVLEAYKDKAFVKTDGKLDRELARLCYMITSIGNSSNLSPIEIQLMIKNKLSGADYKMLKYVANEKTNFGLRAGGTATCPRCHGEASYLALMDDKFFRPAVGDLRKWKLDRNTGRNENISTSKTASVRKHN